MKNFNEVRKTNTEKYDAYYAMVDAKKMAKKKGGKPDDYIDDLMKKRGYKKSSYSGKGVWKWVKEEIETVNEGLSTSDRDKIKAAIKAGKTVIGKSRRKDGSNKGKDFKILKLYVTPIGIITTFKATVDWGDGPKAMDQSFIASYTISESVEEGTMRSGIFDPDIKKRKDAARKLVFFLKAKRNLRIGPMDDKQGGSNKAIDAYIKELMKYVFDDAMIDDLYPTGRNANVKANDVVVKRLKKMGVKVK